MAKLGSKRWSPLFKSAMKTLILNIKIVGQKIQRKIRKIYKRNNSVSRVNREHLTQSESKGQRPISERMRDFRIQLFAAGVETIKSSDSRVLGLLGMEFFCCIFHILVVNMFGDHFTTILSYLDYYFPIAEINLWRPHILNKWRKKEENFNDTCQTHTFFEGKKGESVCSYAGPMFGILYIVLKRSAIGRCYSLLSLNSLNFIITTTVAFFSDFFCFIDIYCIFLCICNEKQN